MKASFMLTTQRQNCNLRDGRVLGLQDPKKARMQKKQIEDDAHLFLWPRGDHTPGICPTRNDGQCRLLLWCSKKVTWNCEATEMGETGTSLSTTTMPRLTGPLKFRSFWSRTTWPWSLIPHTRSGPLWLFPLPQAEASDEGSNIRHHWRDSRGIAAGTWHNSNKGLPGMLPNMA